MNRKLTLSALMVATLGLSAPVLADGNAPFEKHCKVCHSQGLAKAPKLNDKAAWAPRLAKGVDAMTATVLTGKKGMPPKGTCMSCDEAALRAAVEVMVSKVQ